MQTSLHHVQSFKSKHASSAILEDFLSSRDPAYAADPPQNAEAFGCSLQPFFDTPFWPPISPQGCPKVSIVGIWEPKKLHFGSHFGALFGSGCKSEN